MGTDVKINTCENTAPAFLPETGKDNGVTLPELRLNRSELLKRHCDLCVGDTEKSIPDTDGQGHLERSCREGYGAPGGAPLTQ